MKKGIRVAITSLLIVCLALSACHGKKENSEAASSSSNETSSSADPDVVEKLATTGEGAFSYIGGSRVYLSTVMPADMGGGSGELHVISADKDGNTTDLGVIPSVFTLPVGIAKIDSDYYMFVTQSPTSDDSEESDEKEKVLIRVNPEKKEVEVIHYSDIVDWANLSPYESSAQSVGRKVVYLDGYITEEVTGKLLRTFLSVYDVDTGNWSREMECSITNVQTKGDVLFRMCSDGEKIYALYDDVNGKNSTTSLVVLDSDFKELQRIEIGEDMWDVCNRSRVWRMDVWKDLLFISYNSDEGQKIYIGKLEGDKISKVTELLNGSLVMDAQGSAPVLVQMDENLINTISESGEIRTLKLQMDGVKESFISKLSLEGSTLYVNMYYETDQGYGFADYLIHLDKIGDNTSEIVLPG